MTRAAHETALAKVPEETYKADLELLDRYQGYSSELARLSLLGIAALAFFFDRVTDTTSPAEQRDPLVGLMLGVSGLLFTLATACALSHRYHSSDGFAYHVKAIRMLLLNPPDLEEGERAAHVRNRIYKKSGQWLGAAVGFFGAGGVLFFFALARLVYLWVGVAQGVGP